MTHEIDEENKAAGYLYSNGCEVLDEQIVSAVSDLSKKIDRLRANEKVLVEALELLSRHTAIWNNPCSPRDAEVHKTVEQALAQVKQNEMFN